MLLSHEPADRRRLAMNKGNNAESMMAKDHESDSFHSSRFQKSPNELKFASSITTALVVAVAASAVPASGSQAIQERNSEAGINIQLCFSEDFGNCINVPTVATGSCVDLVGGLAGLNDAVSSVRIPLGIFCTFYEWVPYTPYIDDSDGDSITLQGGDYPSLASIPDDYGVTVNFDNRLSSLRCSPSVCQPLFKLLTTA
ncbi:hypothetical protein NP233_g7099 [Leucocoprinus birnbaumii]|uniref:Uncharacterized protein n=1 Tax=Leucocoprinus birnbaumii TaxID=56174 RepID=A0AAD5VSJ2_9AGAR|nr:hypothetical protein NP233_g7099 [Leucocoprinus birnbaumii]